MSGVIIAKEEVEDMVSRIMVDAKPLEERTHFITGDLTIMAEVKRPECFARMGKLQHVILHDPHDFIDLPFQISFTRQLNVLLAGRLPMANANSWPENIHEITVVDFIAPFSIKKCKKVLSSFNRD